MTPHIECYSADSNSAHNYNLKTSGWKIIYINAKESSMFQISAKYTHSHGCNITPLKIYVTFMMNLHTTPLYAYTHRGLENVSEKYR